MVYAVTGAAVL